MRNFGFKRKDTVINIGTNAKMSEFAAAYGLVHLEELHPTIEQNKKIQWIGLVLLEIGKLV